MNNTTPAIAANKRAAAFLKPPYPTEAERAEAQRDAAASIRQALELLVRAGRDDLAFRALELAQDAEARA